MEAEEKEVHDKNEDKQQDNVRKVFFSSAVAGCITFRQNIIKNASILSELCYSPSTTPPVRELPMLQLEPMTNGGGSWR